MLPPTYSYDILPYGQQYSQQPINQSSNMNNQYAAQYCHQPYPTYYGPAIGDRNRNIQWPNQYPQFNAFNIIDHRSPSRRQDQQQVQRTQEEWSYRRRE